MPAEFQREKSRPGSLPNLYLNDIVYNEKGVKLIVIGSRYLTFEHIKVYEVQRIEGDIHTSIGRQYLFTEEEYIMFQLAKQNKS